MKAYIDEGKHEHREQIAQLAGKAFYDHELSIEGVGRWLCRSLHRGGATGHHWFRVISAPGILVVTGDIGHLVLHPYVADPVAWLRSSNSMDYVLGKAAAATGPLKVFCRGDALPDLKQWWGEDHPEIVERIYKAYVDNRDIYGDETAWVEAWLNEGHRSPSETPIPRDWNSELLWMWHALQLFCRMLAAKPALVEPTAPAMRPEVAAFAKRMEDRLRLHDGTRRDGWKNDTTSFLLDRIIEECMELRQACETVASLERDSSEHADDIRSEVIEEAADVANFALFLAHNVGHLNVEP